VAEEDMEEVRWRLETGEKEEEGDIAGGSRSV